MLAVLNRRPIVRMQGSEAAPAGCYTLGIVTVCYSYSCFWYEVQTFDQGTSVVSSESVA